MHCTTDLHRGCGQHREGSQVEAQGLSKAVQVGLEKLIIVRSCFPGDAKSLLSASNDNINYKDIGTKDIYQIEMPVKVKAPSSWTKVGRMQTSAMTLCYWVSLISHLLQISGTKDVNR